MCKSLHFMQRWWATSSDQVCSMIMLALLALERLALERLNAKNDQLLKLLDIESLELLSQIENRVQEFSRKNEHEMLEEHAINQALDPLLEMRHEGRPAQSLRHLGRGHSQAPARPGLPRNGVSSSSPLRGSPPVSSSKRR